MEGLEKLERRLEAGGKQVGTVERRPPRIQVECGEPAMACPPGDVRRVRVVQIGDQAGVVLLQAAGQSSAPPASRTLMAAPRISAKYNRASSFVPLYLSLIHI